MTWYTWITRWGDILYIIKTLVIYGIGCQVVVRTFVYITKSDVLARLLHATDELYRVNIDVVRGKVMGKCIDEALRAFKILFWLYFFSVSLFLVSPIYDYVFKSEKTLIFPYELPFIDSTSDSGYIMTLICHLIIEGHRRFPFDWTFGRRRNIHFLWDASGWFRGSLKG